MLPLGTQRVNEKGHLEIGGCDTVELAEKFGTPLYVLDERAVRERCREYRGALETRYPRKVKVYYAGKAFLTLAMCRLAAQEGLGLDVTSAGELHTALQADFPPEDIALHGNFKSEEEMRLGIESRVGRIVVDSRIELEQLAALAAEYRRTVPVLLRLNPGIKAGGHEFIETGHIDSKFGLSISTGQALQTVQRALELPHLDLRGVHCHIGSQILATEPFGRAAEVVMEFLAEIRRETEAVLTELNLGGGLGIRYTPADDPPSVEEYAEVIVTRLLRAAERHNFPLPTLMVEPGRSIVGEAGITLYTIGVIKEVPGVRTYVAVDGGMSDNPRPALYKARYEVFLANRAAEEPTQVVTVSGKHCETDTLFEEVVLAPPQVGDLLAVQSTGAYHYSMASNYNRFCRPAVVLVREGQAEVIVERETWEDLLAHDALPTWLRD